MFRKPSKVRPEHPLFFWPRDSRRASVLELLRRQNDAIDVVDGARSQQRVAGKVIVATNHIREPSTCKLYDDLIKSDAILELGHGRN